MFQSTRNLSLPFTTMLNGGLMTILPGVALTVAGCAGALIADELKARRLRGVFKIAASLGFVLVGFSSWSPGEHVSLLQAGLIAAAIGDAALIGRDKRALLAGIAAFAMTHLLYSAAFMTRIVQRPGINAAIGLALGLGGAAVAGHLAWTWLAPHVRSLKTAVRAYTALATLMCGLSLAALVAWLGTAYMTIAAAACAGAVLFCVSDAAVARDRLLGPSQADRRWGLPVYYVAQLLLAWVAVRGF